MRNEFLEVATIEEARAAAPWAAEIVQAEGGFHAFESMDDYNNWIKNTDEARKLADEAVKVWVKTDEEARQEIIAIVEEENLSCPEQVCDAVLAAWKNGEDWNAVLAEAVANDAKVAKQLGVE
jgi:hypothetical protein